MVAGMLSGGRQDRRLGVRVSTRDEEFGEPRPGVEGGTRTLGNGDEYVEDREEVRDMLTTLNGHLITVTMP